MQGCKPYSCVLPLSGRLEQESACLSLWALSFFYETDLGVSRPLGALHKVDRDERRGSQLLLYLLSMLEHPNRQHTRGIRICLCLLHYQGQQKPTSGKLLLFFPVSTDGTSMRMETSLVEIIDDPLCKT